MFKELEQKILKKQQENQMDSYTRRLLTEEFLVERKVHEEMYEVIEAAFKEKKEELVYETCDLIYHLMVLLRKYGISLEEIEKELKKREKDS